MNETPAFGAYSFAEMNYLRLEAMDLFERCLTEGQTLPLEVFVQHQISQDPPRVELLREVAEDLHQRLLSLRENHFDVRDRALRLLREDFSLDLSPMIPLRALESYHLLDTEEALRFLGQQLVLSPQDEVTLRATLKSSLDDAAQLHHDVTMTEKLHSYVMDWVMGLNATVTRRFWAQTGPSSTGERVH